MSEALTVVVPPRSKKDRRHAMQQRLLDATIESLVKRGYAGATTLEVQARAGVSRGALLHHYGSRDELILAAVSHLYQIRQADLEAHANAELDRSDPIPGAIRLLWKEFSGPLFHAALELWMAARTDPALLKVLLPHERVIGREIRSLCIELFGEPAASRANFDEFCTNLLNMMRGAAVSAILRAPVDNERMLDSWVRYARLMLDQPEPAKTSRGHKRQPRQQNAR